MLVAARPDPKTMSRQHIARIARNGAGGIDETPVCPSRLQSLLPGEALALEDSLMGSGLIAKKYNFVRFFVTIRSSLNRPLT